MSFLTLSQILKFSSLTANQGCRCPSIIDANYIERDIKTKKLLGISLNQPLLNTVLKFEKGMLLRISFPMSFFGMIIAETCSLGEWRGKVSRVG